jgi:hypothetical protein
MMRYFREYIGEGQEEITRAEAINTLSLFYRDTLAVIDNLDSGKITTVRLPGGYLSAEQQDDVA